MNGFDDVCVVCGEPSTALICRECETLLRAKPRTARVRNAATVARPPFETAVAGVSGDD